jgi:heme/copper-type cytochrome/quinol oxidase subunit 3
VTKPERTTVDVSALPTIVFGQRGLLWWGTIGFAVIEGMTLLLSVASYFYLRRNFGGYPPDGLPAPEWRVPTIGAVLFLLTLIPAYGLKRAASRLDRKVTTAWLLLLSVCGLLLCGVRVLDFYALRVLWSSTAYGSVVWILLGFHGSLLLIEASEVIGTTAIFVFGPVLPRHYPDTCDITNYWYFLVGSWIPIWFIVFMGPRVWH